jgi:hypothetical protein
VSKYSFQIRNAKYCLSACIRIGLKIARIVMSSKDGWMTIGLSMLSRQSNVWILLIVRVFQVDFGAYISKLKDMCALIVRGANIQ